MLDQRTITPVPWEVMTNPVGLPPLRRTPDVAGETRTVVEEYLLRLTKGDAEHIAQLFADEVECYVAAAEAAPWLASRGLAADFLRLTMPRFELGESTVEADRILVDGTDAVVLGHFTHVIKPSGRRLSSPAAIHLSVREGRITSMHLYEDNVALVSRIRGKRPITSAACEAAKNALQHP